MKKVTKYLAFILSIAAAFHSHLMFQSIGHFLISYRDFLNGEPNIEKLHDRMFMAGFNGALTILYICLVLIRITWPKKEKI